MGVEQKNVPVVALFLAEQFATKHLEKGRNWDLAHTKAVVYYAGKIAGEEGLDALVLLTTAWFHDTGYDGLFDGDESKSYEEVEKRKKIHNVKSAEFVADFLSTSEAWDYYSDEQVDRIQHLVYVHDQLGNLKDADEIAFMEADTLGQIDVSRVTPTFEKPDAVKYIKGTLISRRFPRFQTETGKQLFKELYPKFLNYFGIPMEGEYKLF